MASAELHQPIMSLTLPLLVIFILALFRAQTLVCAQQDKFTNCSTLFECGNITKIGYPFWGSPRPSYCGHPDFHLTCSGQTASMSMSELTYQVLNIDNSLRVLTLARTDYLNNICPQYLHNDSIDANHFTYDQDTLLNLTIYYNCSTAVSSNYVSAGLLGQTNCTINGTESSGYYLINSSTSTMMGGALDAIYEALDSCSDMVVAPANKSVVPVTSSISYVDPDEPVGILGQGFGLLWDADNTDASCSACKGTGGACGYSNDRFYCYCSSGEFALRCNDSSTSLAPSGSASPASDKDSKNVSLPIGLAIGGAAIFGLFLGGWFCLLARRRKRKSVVENQNKELLSLAPINKNKSVHTVPVDLSMSIPPYPYSNSNWKSDLQKGSTYFGVQVFSLTELEEATDNFDHAKELGSGGFGTVYHGILSDGRSVAVKRLFDNSMKREEQFMNEVEILNRLRHRNLVTLYGCTSRRTRELIFVYEYVPNGTVADHIHGDLSKSSFLPWPIRLSIAIETADALAYLHTSDVIHRDVKTNNILLDNNFRVKVADFGLSRLFPNNVTHVSTAPQGTPGYVDPEYYHTYQLTNKSDVYSFGVVLMELISSLPAVDTNRHRQDVNLASMTIFKIQSGSITELIDPLLGSDKDNAVRKMATSIAELAFRCLQHERDMRPTMNEVYQALRKIQDENCPTGKCETMVEISEDDVSPLKQVSPPLSPDSTETDRWVGSSTLSSS